MKFSTLLQHFREIKGISKRDLAKKVGVTPTYIGQLESGSERAPTIDRCREIARALSLSPAEEQQLIDAAIEERMPQETLEWHLEKMKSFNLKNGKLDEAGEIGFVRVPLYSQEECARIKKSSPFPKTNNYVIAPARGGSVMIAVNLKGEIIVVDVNKQPKKDDTVLMADGEKTAILKFKDVPKEIAVLGVVVMSIRDYR